jgi:hypothetical protein
MRDMPDRLESRIDAVTVYRSGALVTRVAHVKAGTSSAQMGPLPFGIDDASIRVALDGAGVIARDVRVILEVPALDATLAARRPEEIEAAEEELARLRDRREQLRRESARIETIGVVARPSPRPGREPAPSPSDTRVALLALREKRLAEIDEVAERADREIRDVERRLSDLRERDRRASSARRAEPHELRKAAVVSFSAPAANDGLLAITYRVDAARWAPSYVLRLDRALARGTLEVRAVVAQKTDEDWDGVALSLSTAELRGWAELPELAAIRIGRRQDTPQKSGWRAPPIGAEALFADFDRARAPITPPKPRPAMEPIATFAADLLADDLPAAAPLAAASFARAEAAPAFPPQAQGELRARMNTARQAPEKAKRAAAPRGGLGMFGEGGGGVELDEEEAAAELSLAMDEAAPLAEPMTAMLDYGQLHMPGPTEHVRGKLVLRTRVEAYVALVRELSIEVDVSRAVGSIDRAVRELEHASLPDGCTLPVRPSGYDYVYRAEGRVVAPSDGVFHNVALGAYESIARPRFVIVPRESRDAFRFVEIDNPLDAPLLEGPIDVYAGDGFLTSSIVRDVPPRGVLRLGLGVDQRIKVARNARYKEKSGGLMGGRLDLAHEIEVELESHLPALAIIEVRERVPTLREDEDAIEIVDESATPPWKEWEPEDDDTLRGGRRWTFELAPGGKQKLLARYTVRIASKHELVGGNRREA